MLYLISQIIFCLVLALVAGFLMGWGAARREARPQMEELKRKHSRALESLREELAQVKQMLKHAEAERAEAVSEWAAGDVRLRGVLEQVADLVARLPALERNGEPGRGLPVGVLAAETETPPARDDLKKIAGIGRNLERTLNRLGVWTYRDIALWTDQDVERMRNQLGGARHRIRREEWMEGARREHYAKYGEQL
jgi:hypothetical protein